MTDVSALSKPDRARELSRGLILMYLFKNELAPAERTVLEEFEACAPSFRVIVAKSPLPDRHQVRIGPALVVYEEGKLKGTRAGVLESREMLDRWLRAIKKAPPQEASK